MRKRCVKKWGGNNNRQWDSEKETVERKLPTMTQTKTMRQRKRDDDIEAREAKIEKKHP